MDLQELAFQGNQAQELLNHPLIQQFFSRWEEEGRNRLWECPKWDDVKELFEQKEQFKAFRTYFELTIAKGMQAKSILDQGAEGLQSTEE